MESNFGENNEEIPLADLDRRPETENDDDVEETNIDDEDDEDDSIYDWDPLEDVEQLKNLNINEVVDINVLNIIKFLDDVVVDYPKEYKNSNFIKYLIKKHEFKITKTTSIEGNNVDYEIIYYGKPYINEDNLIIRPARTFYTEDGKFTNDVEFQQFRDDMNHLYDKWKDEVLKRRIKKAGLVGGVLIAVGDLISGLSLGLKRSGHSMVHDSKEKWKKLTPAEKKQIVIPWTELEKASGKGAIVVGDYLYVLIGGAILVYTLKK